MPIFNLAKRGRFIQPALTMFCVLASLSCKQTADSSQVADALAGSPSDDTAWWEQERARREAALNKYMYVDHKEDFYWFRDWPLGHSGMPYLVHRLFPKLFPEIWGDQENFAGAYGLMKHPDDTYPFPLGIGWVRSDKPIFRLPGLSALRMHVTNFTCATCHSSRVRKTDGSFQYLYGAPANEFDAGAYALAIDKSFNHVNFNYKKIKELMDGEDVGYFYGTGLKDKAWERFERGIFRTKGEAIITRMKEGYQQRTEKINKVLRAEIYNSPSRPSMDGGQPGSMDAMGIGIAKGMPATREKTDWPKQSAFVDIMSVWRQKDRPQAQWTASMTHTLYRNLGAELGVIGVPEETNLENSVRTSRFLNELPSPPYPFTVRKSLADKGKALFDKNCQSCHKAGTTEIYPPQDVGTDPNRVAVFNDATRGDLIAGLRKACPDKKICAGVPDDSILKKETGYMAVPLDGIWARAPYLHNGSVPTLRHLLVPELREEANAKTFWRGNPDYDQKNVGWVWDQQKMPTAKRYSTSLEGNSNKGHDAGRYLRSDGKGRWEGEELEALLEYLKTL